MGKFEGDPNFEKPVPWDESVVPPAKRAYLRKLYEDPKEVERFWSDEILKKNLQNQAFQEMVVRGFSALAIAYNFHKKEGDEEFNRRFEKFEQDEEEFFDLADPRDRSETLRQWFALKMKFMMDEGVPKEKFDLAPFLGRAYEFEAENYRENGISVGDKEGSNIYPFEKPRAEVITQDIRQSKPERAHKKRTEDKRYYHENLPPDEKELAEKGEEYLSRQAWPELKRRLLRLSGPGSEERREAHRDFERRYQEKKIEEDKKKNEGGN